MKIIRLATPPGQSELEHRAEVWIFAEARLLLRRASERCFIQTLETLLDEVHCTADSDGVIAGDLFLTLMKEGSGGQGMSTLLSCCYGAEYQHTTRDGDRLVFETTTEDGLNKAAVLLLGRGASPMKQAPPGRQPEGNHSMYPLFMATVNANVKLVRAFLKASPSADPGVTVDDGNSALVVARSAKENYKAQGAPADHPAMANTSEIVRLLEARVADLSRRA